MLLASNRCGPCKQFQPTAQAMLRLDGQYNSTLGSKIHYKIMEEIDDANMHKVFNIKAVPTILVFSPVTGKFVAYKGARTPESINAFAVNYHRGTSKQPVTLWESTPKLTLGM